MQQRYDHVHFGSGGFGALSFLGALACIEQYLDSDYDVSGTSAGAILAFMIVLGYTSTELMALMYSRLDDGTLSTTFFDWQSIRDYEATGILLDFQKSWDLLSEMCRTRLGRAYDFNTLTFSGLQKACGGRRFSVVATSISEARMTIFTVNTHPDMPIRQAIEASTCIPMLAEPVRYRGDLYVDGFVTDTAALGNNPLVIRLSKRNPDDITRTDNPDFITYTLRTIDAMINTAVNALSERNSSFTMIIEDVPYQNLIISGMTRDDLFERFVRGRDAAVRFFKKRV